MSGFSERYMPEIIGTRRRFHRRPELGWTEFETTAFIITRLEALGYEVHTGREIINPDHVLGRDPKAVAEAEARALQAGVPEALLRRMDGFTGAVGILDTGRPGPVAAFRFEIDALPIQEITDPASGHLPAAGGFASEIPGRMHACGHDAHAAIGLGLARWASEHRSTLRGRVKLVFQPAEEGTRGAAAMAASGIVDDADWLFGAHVGAPAKPSEIFIVERGFMATTKFDLDFTGVPSHAGAAPEKGRSALLAASDAALLMSAIPRTSQGDTRISVGKLAAGDGRNITPSHAHMECEVRGSTWDANSFMFGRAREAAAGAAAAFGVKCVLTKTGEASDLFSTPAAVDVMRRAATKVSGTRAKVVEECSGSEDCTMLMRSVEAHGGNAGFFLYGCSNRGHHRPDFDVQDTENLRPGFEMFVNILRIVSGIES
ncbi:MAG: amidohydrolase [Sutterellaceae bacterium]|nr:amidohydrolase [Sutterellaceae bacterium]MDY2868530.1 amidohydrolase [Mesosutterella sp.]